MPDAPLPPPAAAPPPRARTAWADTLRYRTPYVLVHLLLVVLCALNVYPFVWMIGTSLKAEEEASSDRLSPVPRRKYELSPTFDLHDVLPLHLDPAAARLPEARERLQLKLRVIDRLQREATVRHVRSWLAADADRPGYDDLVEDGILVETETGVWPSELPPDPVIAEPYLVTPRTASLWLRTDLEEAEALLDRLATEGVLLPVEGRTTEEGEPEPAFALMETARGRLTEGGLYPRQVLTLWSMDAENVRRAEARSTFARDSRSASDYARAQGLADEAQAEAELDELRRRGWLTGATAQWMNYWVVLKEENFLLHFMTSALITAVIVSVTVMVTSMLGYALARMKFPGKFLVLGIMIFSSVLPTEARIIPIFKMLLGVGAMENLWGMTIWLSSFGMGNALLMAGFFLTLPKEVDEAASVDGAGPFRMFFDIAFPMARPIVMTVGLFAFLTSWNEFLVPLLCTISRPSMQPLAVAVYNFQQGHPGKWHQINAAASVMIVPVLILFILVQKHVVKSIAVGAVKG